MPETIRIGADQARAKLRDLLDGVRANGDVVEITRWNRTEAVLMAPPPVGFRYELVKDEGDQT